jgi:hypothetical protein
MAQQPRRVSNRVIHSDAQGQAGPIAAFAALPARQAQRVGSVLSKLPSFATKAAIREAVREVLPVDSQIDGTELVRALSLVAGQEGEADPKSVAKRLSDSKRLKLSKNRRPSFARNIARLLASPVVQYYGKADDVITDHARIFSTAKVLTDIRPVFGDDLSEPPPAAVIVDMLRIDHFDRKEGKGSYYVALDHADLLKLRNVIDRALEKTKTVQQLLNTTGMTYYEHQEVEGGDEDNES